MARPPPPQSDGETELSSRSLLRFQRAAPPSAASDRTTLSCDRPSLLRRSSTTSQPAVILLAKHAMPISLCESKPRGVQDRQRARSPSVAPKRFARNAKPEVCASECEGVCTQTLHYYIIIHYHTLSFLSYHFDVYMYVYLCICLYVSTSYIMHIYVSMYLCIYLLES